MGVNESAIDYLGSAARTSLDYRRSDAPLGPASRFQIRINNSHRSGIADTPTITSLLRGSVVLLPGQSLSQQTFARYPGAESPNYIYLARLRVSMILSEYYLGRNVPTGYSLSEAGGALLVTDADNAAGVLNDARGTNWATYFPVIQDHERLYASFFNEPVRVTQDLPQKSRQPRWPDYNNFVTGANLDLTASYIESGSRRFLDVVDFDFNPNALPTDPYPNTWPALYRLSDSAPGKILAPGEWLTLIERLPAAGHGPSEPEFQVPYNRSGHMITIDGFYAADLSDLLSIIPLAAAPAGDL